MKRPFDIVASAAGLVMTSPILLAAAVAVRLDSRGPAFYRGVRVGKDGRRFHILKLRTMVDGADRVGPPLTTGTDARLTRVGRILRRTKLDELPQLLNVLRGDMSLVGPRPEHPDYVALYSPEQRRVLDVRPGITGPSTIAYADEEAILVGANPERDYVERVMPDKLAIDLRYIERQSFLGDVAILVRTLGAIASRVVSRRGASRRGFAG